jgi:hypothetical protein
MPGLFFKKKNNQPKNPVNGIKVPNKPTLYTDCNKPRFNRRVDLTMTNVISNPVGCMNTVLATPSISKMVNSISSVNRLVDSVKELAGYDTTQDYNKYDRELIEETRPNDLTNIKSDYISDKKLLNNKNIPVSGVTLDITVPKNINWKLNEADYINNDLSKLPESIIKSKDKDKISLEDKKEITIPYKVVDNTYQLSCSDSYFSKNKSEKTNLLKDIDSSYCSVNKDNNVQFYNAEKKREKNTNDLSNYS